MLRLHWVLPRSPVQSLQGFASSRVLSDRKTCDRTFRERKGYQDHNHNPSPYLIRVHSISYSNLLRFSKDGVLSVVFYREIEKKWLCYPSRGIDRKVDPKEIAAILQRELLCLPFSPPSFVALPIHVPRNMQVCAHTHRLVSAQLESLSCVYSGNIHSSVILVCSFSGVKTSSLSLAFEPKFTQQLWPFLRAWSNHIRHSLFV